MQKDSGISSYEIHLLPILPEPDLQSSFDALTQHYQSRRPAQDGIVVGEESDAHFTLHQ